MKPTHLLNLAVICGIGLLSGFLLRRLDSKYPHTAPPGTSGSSAEIRQESPLSATAPAGSSKPVLPEIPITRSTDTVASILALDPQKNYARIALWTATASEQDLAAYWAGYKGGKRSVDVTDLIFLNWTRRNPHAAVAAVTGTGDERYAWWSWASNDPKSALAASLSEGKDAQEQVACGIGDFNPDWLRTHLGEIPEEFRDDAFNRLKNWPDSQNPLESLKFMKANGMGFDPETFKSLVRKDPWAALDWLKENPNDGRQQYSSVNEALNSLVSILSQERPEDLERIAAQTPPGETKRRMDQALFDRLVETDPAAALEKAKEIQAPLIAAQRMAKVGLSLLATDPAKAFEIAGEILKANPDQLSIRNKVEYAGGWTMYGEGGPATDLMTALFNKDRASALKLMADNSGDKKTTEPLAQYSKKWADSDLVGFSEWANQQTGKLHAVAAQQIGNSLAAQGSFEEAIEWAGSGPLEADKAYNAVLFYWNRADPSAAAAWLENSNLTAAQKEKYRSDLKKFSR